ncbi:MAG: MATE family efflux transporter [Gaiellales bacterium]
MERPPAGGGVTSVAHTQEDQDKARANDLRMVARGGSLNFVGAAANGIFQFLLVVVVAQALTKSQSGAFFEAVALFLILSNTCELGADTGLTRMIPLYRVQGRLADIRASLGVGMWPALAAGLLFAVLTYVFAHPLAELFTHKSASDAAAVADYIRVLAVFLPLAGVYTVAIAATRGFGTMLPNALIDRIAKSAAQTAAVAVVVFAGGGASEIAVAWGVPFVLGFAAALLWLRVLLRETLVLERREALPPPTRLGKLASEFWSFTAPRGLTGVFQVTILWVGTLMVGNLRSTADASVYTASTRYLVAGSVVNLAIIQVIAPKLSELLSANQAGRARNVYQVATSWLMALAWPMYLTLALFAPVLLRVFGHKFTPGASSLVILACAMIVATGIGPVDVVLLMGGRSFWNLFNVAVALVINVVLSLALIPHIGIAGAAIAWAAAILFNNVAPLLEVRAFLKVHPFGRGFPVVAGSALLCFGGIGLLVRLVAGASVPGFIVYGVLATAAYVALLYRVRERVEIPLLMDTVMARRAR